MSDTTNNSNVNNQPSTATEVSIIPPGSQEKGESTSNKHYAWTRELDIALLEEVGNLGAHTPGHNQATKCWLNVLEALKSRGVPYDNHRTIQRRFYTLKDKFVSDRAKREATSGREDFGDDDDPFTQLMEDLLQEIQDFEAEKSLKRDEKKSREAELVAGGQKLRDKAAHQLLSGVPFAIGGMRPSPTSSVSDVDVSATTKSKESSTASTSKKRPGRFFEDFDLVEHENKKMELEVRKLDLECKKFEAEMQLKREQYQQNLAFHNDAMDIKKREIDAQHQAIQMQMSQHQDNMRMKFLEFEQRMKGDNK